MEYDNVRLDSIFGVSIVFGGHHGFGPNKKPQMVVMGTCSVGIAAISWRYGICAGLVGHNPHHSSLCLSRLSAMQIPAHEKRLERRLLPHMWHG
jgi:hypothetical protein